MKPFAILTLLVLSACTTIDTAPSLAPRAAEAIDPRLPVGVEPVVQEASSALAARLAALVQQAQAGDAAFQDAIRRAGPLAAAAGAPQSESWIVAQQAISVAQAARAPTTRALGDIDTIAASAIAQSGGIPLGDLAAIQRASADIAAISNRQAQALDALKSRLGY